MKARRLALATILAITMAVTFKVSTAADGLCFPLCPLYTPSDLPYWLFGCDSCPPNPPDAG